MRIVFLCSSLEPGRDGVGDYSTLLAKECTRQGHPTALIALNDRHSPRTVEGVFTAGEPAHAEDVPYLRLPSREDWATRTTKAITFLREFAPDWISLQFVGYGFHDKGIVAKQVPYFRAISRAISQARTHVMLHELWIGGSNNSSVKHNAAGIVQRYYILSLIKSWHPTIIHTSNEYYRRKLSEYNIPTVVLPLFSNIPISKGKKEEWLNATLGESDSFLAKVLHDQYLLGGFFGTLHKEWMPEPVVSYLEAAANKMSRKLMLLSAGRMGAEGEKLWRSMQQRYADRIPFVDIGARSPRQISEYLQNLDFGIAASPVRLIGKSGTVAAMLDHGLPVVISRIENNDLMPWSERSKTLLRIADRSLSHWQPMRLPPADSLPIIAQQFYQTLSKTYDAE